MANGRFKDKEFNLADDKGNIGSWDHVAIAALYDIRDELKQLNCTLNCTNFLDIPFKLDRIEKNTRKPRKRKVAKKVNRGKS